MKALLLALLLAAAGPVASQVLYLGSRDPGRATGVMVPVFTGWDADLFRAELSRGQVRDRCAMAKARAGARELWLAIWCTNQWAYRTPRASTLVPWDDDAAWSIYLRNLAWLGEEARAVGASGILMDAENYNLGPRARGHWPAHPRIAERARAYRLALGPNLTLGHYGTVALLKRDSGYRRFWSTVGGLVLAEDSYTLGVDPERLRRRGLWPGFWRRPNGQRCWVYDP